MRIQTRKKDRLRVIRKAPSCRRCGSEDMVRYGFDYSSIAKGTVKQIFRCRDCGTYGCASERPRGFRMRYPEALIARSLILMRSHKTEEAGKILGISGRTLRNWRARFA